MLPTSMIFYIFILCWFKWTYDLSLLAKQPHTLVSVNWKVDYPYIISERGLFCFFVCKIIDKFICHFACHLLHYIMREKNKE